MTWSPAKQRTSVEHGQVFTFDKVAQLTANLVQYGQELLILISTTYEVTARLKTGEECCS